MDALQRVLDLKEPLECAGAAAACAALSRSLSLEPRVHAAAVWGHLAPLAEALDRVWAALRGIRAQRALPVAWLTLGTEVCLLIGSLGRLPPPALGVPTATVYGDAFGAMLAVLCDACGATSPLPLVATAAGMLCVFDWIPPIQPPAMQQFMGAAYSALRMGLSADPAALGGRECVEQSVWLLDRIVRKSGGGAAAATKMNAAAAAGAGGGMAWRDWPLTLVRVLLSSTHCGGRLLLHSPQPFSPGKHIIDVILPAACAYLDVRGHEDLRVAIARELTLNSPGYEVLLRALTSRSALRASAAYASVGACLRLLGPAVHQKVVASGDASQQNAAASFPHEQENVEETATNVRGRLASMMRNDSMHSTVLRLLISTVAEAPGVCMPGAVRGAQLASLRVFLDAAAAFAESAKDGPGALQLHTELSKLIDGIAWCESEEEGGAPQLAALPIRLEAVRARVELAAMLAARIDDASADAILQAAVAALVETARIELRAEREGPVNAVVASAIGALTPRDSLQGLSSSEASAYGLGAEFGRRGRPPTAFTFHCAHFVELPSDSGPSYLPSSAPRLISPTPAELPLVARAVKLLFDCFESVGGSAASAAKEAAVRAYGAALASADKVATAAASRNPDQGRRLRADILAALEPEAKVHPLLEDALKRMPAGVAAGAAAGLGRGEAAVPIGSALGKRARDEEAPAPSAPAAVSYAMLPGSSLEAASKAPRVASKSRSKRGVLDDEDD
jgi:hypothetical protein